MKSKYTLLVLAAGIAPVAAQSTLDWRSEATNGNWNDSNNWWSGSAVSPPGSEILRFDNNNQLTMTNDAANTTRHQIIFAAGATDARTIGGSIVNSFVAISGNGPLIQNDSVATHTLNFPISLGSSLTVSANSGGLILGGAITGTGSLIKQGANTLTLSGANSYSGATSVNSGTLSISAENNLGAIPGTYVADQLVLNGGTLKTAVGLNISTNRGITIGTSGATLDNSTAGNGTNFNLNSKITGTGGLTLKANGDTSDGGGGVGGNLSLLNSTNDFTGNITIQSGVVNFSDDGAFGNTANDIVIQGGGLVATANRTLPATRDVVLSGGGNKIFRAYGSVTFTINGSISGSGNVRHTDGGTLVLNGANSFTGNIDNVRGNLTLANSAHTGNVTNSAGTLVLNAGNTYSGYTHITSSTTLRLDADHALPDGSTVLLYGGTTFNANGKTDTLGSLTTGSSGDTSVTVNLGSGANLTITNNNLPAGLTSGYGNATVAGKITGTGNITYNHATTNNAQWDWANSTNDFTGNVTVTQGRLRVASDTALGNAANDLVFNGSPVATFGNQEGKASIQVANGTNLNLGADRDLILNTGKEGTMYVWGGTTMTVNGKITGGGNLRKEDSGLLLLNNAANDWSGETKLVTGEIRVGIAGALSPASTAVIAGGTLNLNGIASSVIGLSGGGNTGGILGGGTTLTVTGSGNYDYSGRVTDTGGATTVKYTGSGSLTLSGTADNSGGRAAVDSGTLILGKSSTASVHAVGASNVVGLAITGGTARLGGTGNDQIYTNTHVDQSGGVFDLNGRNEGFRALIGSGGIVRNDAASTNSVLTLGETTLATDSFTYSGAIENGAGTVDLTKTGLGIQTLTGTNTYTGKTTINGGTLALSATGSISSSTQIILGAATTLDVSATGGWTVGASQTLIGSGTLVGNTTIAGDLRPGTSPGTLTVTGDLGLNSGSDWFVELGGTDVLDFDRLLVSGQLSASGNILVSLVNSFNPAVNNSFQIASFASFAGSSPAFNFISAPLDSGLTWDTSSFSTNGTITVVPEPTSALLAAFSTLALALRRRR